VRRKKKKKKKKKQFDDREDGIKKTEPETDIVTLECIRDDGFKGIYTDQSKQHLFDV
jgi:hypothetical protein